MGHTAPDIPGLGEEAAGKGRNLLAAGGSALDLGSDTGGCVRAPAHYCGITGIKPTSGRILRTGHIVPYGLGALDSLTQIGPMARYVEDLVLTLPIVCGVDGYDPAIIPMPLGDADAIDLKGLRVAVHIGNGITAPTAETGDTLKRAAGVLVDAGVLVEEDFPGVLKRAVSLFEQSMKQMARPG